MLITDVDNLDSAIARFWNHVDARGNCWMWTAALNKGTGYGAFGIKRKGRHCGMDAHRFSYLLAHGEIPDGLLVLHDCDKNYPIGDIAYRGCVCPDHLWTGTQGDNIRDAIAKGRFTRHLAWRNHPELIKTFKRNPARGENAAHAKLTEAQVREIRERYAQGARQVDLSTEYGVNQPHISRLVRGEAWPHIKDDRVW